MKFFICLFSLSYMCMQFDRFYCFCRTHWFFFNTLAKKPYFILMKCLFIYNQKFECTQLNERERKRKCEIENIMWLEMIMSPGLLWKGKEKKKKINRNSGKTGINLLRLFFPFNIFGYLLYRYLRLNTTWSNDFQNITIIFDFVFAYFIIFRLFFLLLLSNRFKIVKNY